MLILWEEYRGLHPEEYGYSRCCELYRSFEQRLSPTMRREHAAGDKVFVDYSDKKIPIVDRRTGQIREAEIFVAVLGASSFTYPEATWTRTLPVRFFGGVPRLIVPDNLKSGVSRASFYDPEINRSYGMMASHYGVGVLPARPRKPREWRPFRPVMHLLWGACAIRPSSRWLKPMPPLARHSIASTTTSCAGWASVAGNCSRVSSVPHSRAFRAKATSCRMAFGRVSTDYHVEFKPFLYSVPHNLILQQVN
ncbi:hypothetical protein [Mesorhizobium sp. M0778]|uniref:hypothetical protein n=1 Tax=Mesorhizobium sp. M0778 TaxID=2956999 RepID=UPI003335A6B9